MDMALAPEVAHAIFSQVRHFYLKYEERILEAAGEEFLMEGFRAYIELAHTYGVKVMHHTCGSVRQLIPLMLDCGLDVLKLWPQEDTSWGQPTTYRRMFLWRTSRP